MITTNNLTHLLHILKFDSSDNKVFTKQYPHFNCAEIRVDLIRQKILYPTAQGLKVWSTTSSSNFDHPENFVVLECVTRLLDKGYRPESIELEKEWKLGKTRT